MDLSSLLCRLAPVRPQDEKRKLEAITFAHGKLLEVEHGLEFNDFVPQIPRAIAGQCFGAPGEDFYLTALLSIAARDRPSSIRWPRPCSIESSCN